MKMQSFIILLLVICLSACTEGNSSNDDSQKTIHKMKYTDVPWEEDNGDITDELYIDTDTAETIATMLFYKIIPEKMQNTYTRISLIEEENILVVSKLPEGDGAGEDYSMAIDQKTGEVLKIWAGE